MITAYNLRRRTRCGLHMDCEAVDFYMQTRFGLSAQHAALPGEFTVSLNFDMSDFKDSLNSAAASVAALQPYFESLTQHQHRAARSDNKEPLFYIQVNDTWHGDMMVFWKKGGGYTCDIDKAELFPESRVKNLDRPIDKAWRPEDLRGGIVRCVNSELVRDKRPAAFGLFEKFEGFETPSTSKGNDP